MKILGKKSLATVIKIFLWILLTICLVVVIMGGIVVIKDFSFFNTTNTLRSLIVLYLSSWPAAILIVKFIGIFRSLENNDIFDKQNLKRLRVSYISSVIMGLMYLINSIMLFFSSEDESWIIIYILLTYVITLVFLIFGVGLIVLSEIYRKAIKYKEENDLTI